MMHTQSRKDWEAAVAQRGAVIEPDGSGMDAAHIDGDPVGYWDPKYAGVGMGVVYEAHVGYVSVVVEGLATA